MAEPGEPGAEVPLQVWGSGMQPSKARRRDSVVLREAGPWSATVLALLRHAVHSARAEAIDAHQPRPPPAGDRLTSRTRIRPLSSRLSRAVLASLSRFRP
jgi:hypothetical protein